MKFVLIVNPELGWDSVSNVLDTTNATKEQMAQLEAVCENRGDILIDWKTLDTVESFLLEQQ